MISKLINFSLQNYYINCRFSEKLVQLVRILHHETLKKASSHFIIYFATCACVDYFYKVHSILGIAQVSFMCHFQDIAHSYEYDSNLLFSPW